MLDDIQNSADAAYENWLQTTLYETAIPFVCQTEAAAKQALQEDFDLALELLWQDISLSVTDLIDGADLSINEAVDEALHPIILTGLTDFYPQNP